MSDTFWAPGRVLQRNLVCSPGTGKLQQREVYSMSEASSAITRAEIFCSSDINWISLQNTVSTQNIAEFYHALHLGPMYNVLMRVSLLRKVKLSRTYKMYAMYNVVFPEGPCIKTIYRLIHLSDLMLNNQKILKKIWQDRIYE